MQLITGLLLRLILLLIGQDKASLFHFKLSIDITFDKVVPPYSDTNFISMVFPITEIGLIVISPKEDIAESGNTLISPNAFFSSVHFRSYFTCKRGSCIL